MANPMADAERATQFLHALRHTAQSEMAGPFPVGGKDWAAAMLERWWPRPGNRDDA